ncbi:MAG: hypothetical protein Q9169_004334 [Polycauliona sp. 2 TL-2023]
MSPPNVQDAESPDGFESVVRGMILGNEPRESVESEASNPITRPSQEPVSYVPTLAVSATSLPNHPHMQGTRRGHDPDTRRQSNQSSSTGLIFQPSVNTRDASVITHGDAPAEYTIRQARQPRRRPAARLNQSNTINSTPAAPTAGPPTAGISISMPRSEHRPSSQLTGTPPAAFNTHFRSSNQPQSHRGSQPRQSQQPQPRNFQQGIQGEMPSSNPYGRPKPQHQRLYDPHAASQQPYQNSATLGRQSSGFSSSQSRHAAAQAQTSYLDSIAQLQIPNAIISFEEEQRKEALRRVLENVCQQAITEHEAVKEPLFDSSTVSLKCFGSLRTGFATRSSDMDLALGSPQSVPDPALPESDIPRVLEKAFLDLGYGARLLTRTRVPIIRFCEQPTPDLAARLREERSKWEKERDALLKTKKAKKSKTEPTSKNQSKHYTIEEKARDGKRRESQEQSLLARHEDELLESERQNIADSASEQATKFDDDPPKQAAFDGISAEDAVQSGSTQRKSTAQDEDVTSRDQRYGTEVPIDSLDSVPSNVADFETRDKTLPAPDSNVSGGDTVSHPTDPTAKVAMGLGKISMGNAGSSDNIELGQVYNKIERQVPQAGRGATSSKDKTVTSTAEPRPRLELTMADEELVRLYRLAMKEGWFEPQERTIIFAYIKASENKSSPDKLDACRSQLLALPDVLSRYRPPPEHHLDFPKDGVGVQCDINFSNRLALHNSHMLRCYNSSDPRVRPMVLFVKAWAKRRKVNSPYHGTLSSYGYVLMVLHYLVNIARPPICLNLQTVEMAHHDTSSENTQTVDGYGVRFWRDEHEIQRWAKHGRITADHHSSVGSLLRGFFHYFAVVSGGFAWGTDVLSLRTPGGMLTKQQKDWIAAKTVVLDPVGEGQKGQEVRQRYLFAIEDPFEINHNIARTVVHNGIVAIRDEFRRANRLIHEAGNGRVTEDLFEEAEAKDDLNYRHFGPRPPRPPQQTKAAADQHVKQKKPSSTTGKVV